MARLLLHIGTHKTGTTMVQNVLHASRHILAVHGVMYPDLSPHTGHHGYLTDWIALPAAYARPEGGKRELARLARELVDTDASLLLSSEELSRAGGPGGRVEFDELREIFAGFDVLLLCVLREQCQFLQSVYVEIARSRVPPNPPALIEAAVGAGLVDGLFCDYGRLHDRLRKSFAPDEMRFFDYGSALAAPGGVLGTLLRHIAPGLPVDALARDKPRSANVSPRAGPLWAAFAVAGGRAPDEELHRAAEQAFALEFGEGRMSCVFTREEIARIGAHFAPSNERVAAALRRVQPEFTLTPRAWGDDTIHREDVTTDYFARLARRLWMNRLAPAVSA
jgi:hypothetical protein